MTGAAFIVSRRNELGITQRQLASMVKRLDGDGSISPQLMNCIEHSRRSYKPYIKDLARALQVHDSVLAFFIGHIPARYTLGVKVDISRIPDAYLAFMNVLTNNRETNHS